MDCPRKVNYFPSVALFSIFHFRFQKLMMRWNLFSFFQDDFWARKNFISDLGNIKLFFFFKRTSCESRTGDGVKFPRGIFLNKVYLQLLDRAQRRRSKWEEVSLHRLLTAERYISFSHKKKGLLSSLFSLCSNYWWKLY